MKRETIALKSLIGSSNHNEDESETRDVEMVERDESPELKSTTDVESSGIWPSNATSPSSILLSQYSMLGAESLTEWQKALEASDFVVFWLIVCRFSPRRAVPDHVRLIPSHLDHLQHSNWIRKACSRVINAIRRLASRVRQKDTHMNTVVNGRIR